MSIFISSCRLLALFTLLLGIAYPGAVWAVGRAFFPREAGGSLVHVRGRLVGSHLLAQKNPDARYFRARPSGGDYATVASAASQQSWTSATLRAALAGRQAALGEAPAPSELLTASGSGLDPDISLAAARFQVARVAAARDLASDERTALDELIAEQAEGGHLAPMRINVLRLNLALDARFPAR